MRLEMETHHLAIISSIYMWLFTNMQKIIILNLNRAMFNLTRSGDGLVKLPQEFIDESCRRNRPRWVLVLHQMCEDTHLLNICSFFLSGLQNVFLSVIKMFFFLLEMWDRPCILSKNQRFLFALDSPMEATFVSFLLSNNKLWL